MIIRELITRLGFEINQSQIANFDQQMGALKNRLGGITRNLNQIGNSFIGLGGRLSLFVTTPLLAANVAAIKVAATFEQLEISFTTMLGSADDANKLIKDMFEFAAKTPFQIKNIGPTVKQLLAFGIIREDIIPTLKSLGDVAAGLGVPIQRLALNFGQVKTQGKLTGRELRDFAMAGVPLLEELSKTVGKSKAEIQDMISRGQISFKMVDEVFKKMTSEGGRFANLMEAQSKTLGGLFSNLMDNLYLIAGGFGEVIVDVLQLKKVIGFLNKNMSKLLTWFQKLNKFWKTWILLITMAITVLGPLLIIIGLIIKMVAFLGTTFIFLKVALLGVAGAAGAFNASMLLMPIIILAIVAALALLLEDIYTWVNNGDSIIGDLLGPWATWRDSMKGFFQDVGGYIYDLVHWDYEELKRKTKLLAKTLGFFFQDLSDNFFVATSQEQADKILEDILREKGKLPKQTIKGETPTPLQWPLDPKLVSEFVQKRQIRELSSKYEPGEFAKAAGMANRPNIGNINISTEVNVAPGEGGEPQDIANVVGEVIDRKLRETVNENLTP